ncbi:ARM repeat-containing protein [Hesseltinella vesiculosa]|uniref:ARM repeat-containing protein n=1 Tax=Hesseltinella vesiculosa TaxID=101127 RepID=A0A1X2GJM4_9FUNG|nr:ARM repeat-containing protein [Hesseltinella vesiculosa]
MDEEDFQSIPLVDRLQNKVWKARLSAYTELHDLLRKTVDDSDFYKYEHALKAIVTDANAVAQEAGLNAVYEYVNNAPNAASTREAVVPALVQKCLGAAKAGTKQKAVDIILLYAEVDVPDPVVELVLPGLAAKQPKLVTQTVVALKELVSQFGAKHVSPKPLIKILPKLFGHSDKNVRAETFALTTEIYRYIGSAMMASLSDLKPVQLKELEEAFAKLPSGRPVPPRLLRSEQAVAEAQDTEMPDADDDAEDDATPMEEEPMDPYDLADPVDITTKLPSNFYELIASKKWQERREALDAIAEAAKTPKILDSDYTELVNALAKRINDTNILLVGTAAGCIGAMAVGLRQDFGKYKAIVAPPMVEKLKERKPATLEQVANGLHEVFSTVPLVDLAPDISSAVGHKNPQIRAQCMKLLARQFQTIRQPPGKAEIKTYATLMLKTLDDADASAREHSAEGLGTLMKVVGEKMMLAYIDDLDDIKKGKIKDAFDKAEVKAKPAMPKKAAPPPAKKPPTAARRAPPPASKPTPMVVDDEDDTPPPLPPKTMPAPKRKPPTKLAGGTLSKKPTLSAKKPATASAGPAKKAAKLPPSTGQPETVSYKFSPDDVDARATEAIPDQIWQEIAQSQWKVRLAAMESLHSHLSSEDPSAIEPELVIRCLAKKPGWKEMNFQVMTKMYGIMELLASECPGFTRGCAAIGIPGIVEKLGDIKLKKPAGECLVMFAETTSLQFVLSQSYPIWKKAKSPKVIADSLMWTHQAITDFGIQGLQIRDLIDFIKQALSNTNASVRTSAVTVLGVLRQYVGPEIITFVQDVSPALMANIEAEFDKVAKLDPPMPTKGAVAAPANENGSAAASGNADPLDSLIPRVDITNQLAKVSSECNDASWKIRKEGLDKVLAIIEGANKRIKPNLGDFPANVLKNRLEDNNKNLQIQAVEITGLLAVAMGKPFDKYAKPLAPQIIGLLADNKVNVRNAGVATLEIIRQNCGLELMMSAFGTSLAADAPALRKDLLNWLVTCLAEPDLSGAAVDASPVITPLFSCLQDRNADVRKAAQAFLPLLITNVGFDQILGRTSDLKGAQRQTVVPLLEAAASTLGVSATAAATPSPAASAAPPSRAAPKAKPEARRPADRTAATAPGLRKKLPAPSSRLASASTSPASAAPVDTPANHSGASAPVLTNDPRAKLMRAKKEIRWQFDAPRADIVDGLKHVCDGHIAPEVLSLMFSTHQYAERERLQALQQLNDAIGNADTAAGTYGLDADELRSRYVCNADLLFKYLTLRFFDTNTSMLIRCLDLTQHIIASMDEQGYHLSEYEAVSFLPFLINKVGDPKEVMRTRIRAILKAICRIYPASKLFNYLLEAAANSKNAKTRAECLEEVGALVQRNGMSVMLPNKSLPLIATHIGDRDAGVRNAALSAIAQAYILVGDAVFKHLTRLGEKEKSMLEERLKRTKPSASVLAERERVQQLEKQQQEEADAMDVDDLPPISQLPQPRTARSRLTKPRTLPQPVQRNSFANASATSSPQQHPATLPSHHHQEPPMDDYPPPAAGPSYPALTSPLYQTPSPAQHAYQQQQQQQQQMPPPGEYLVDYLIAHITNGEPQPSIDALKQLDKYLNTQPELILPDTDALINAITLQVRMAYTNVDPRSPITTRLCKHLVNALVLFFSNQQLASSVSQDALHHLLQELAHRLLDQKMLALESGPQLSKALNVAMVKVLENSQNNATFSALLSILGTCSAGLRPGDSALNKETKYTELIMKCLWKLAKTIQDNLRSGVLRPDQLLYEINQFFLVTPPSEWKRRTLENVPLGELPLRTVKTLLLELVNGLGEGVFDHLGLIEDAQRSSVYPYLHHMLEACRKREMLQQQQHPPAAPSYASHHPPHSDTTPARPLSYAAPSAPMDHQPSPPTQRYSYHEAAASAPEPTYDDQQSRHSVSSFSRPSSFSSFRSHQLLRSGSMGSHPSTLDDQAFASATSHLQTMPSPRSAPASAAPVVGMVTHHASDVQPMQIDEHPINEPTAKLPATLSDYEMNNILTQIFEKIGTREQTKQGIVELYEFQKRFPLAENKVNNYLNQTGTYFQRYIRRGLSNLAADDHS